MIIRQRLGKVVQRGFEFAAIVQDVAQIDPRLAMVWIQFERAAEMDDSVRIPPQSVIRVS